MTVASKEPPPVIDLTESDDNFVIHSVTPEQQHPTKRQRRVSRRVQEAQQTTRCHDDVQSGSKEVTRDRDEKVYHKNDYYEVDQILDRRTKKFGGELASEGRHVVEYLVRWKNPPWYNGEGYHYEDSWQIAENLNQHSLASAFRQFPVEGDLPQNNEQMADNVHNINDKERELGLLDEDLFDEEDEILSEGEEVLSDDKESSEEDKDDEYDAIEEIVSLPHHDIAHLGKSEYDSPGTVELQLNRKTYRVGQSFISPDGNSFYTISMILPIHRKAKLVKFMKMEKCFACPKGKEDFYIQLSDEVILDLSLLKTYIPSKLQVKKFSMKYEESENQRSFCYYNENAKILHHPTGKPVVLELFAGVGGMSLGLENAGFNVKYVVDSDSLAAATHSANNRNPDLNVYPETLSSFLKNCIQENPAYPKKSGEVDHIHASPPCKGFSSANRNGGKDDLLNNKQTLLFIKAVQHFLPKTVTFENVAGLSTPNFKGYLKFVVASLLTMQYQVRVELLNASAFGDPQHRRRLFIFASRHDCFLPSSPLPTHGLGPNLLPIKTCKDALQIFEKEPTCAGAVVLRLTDTKVWSHNAPHIAPNKDKDYELIEDQPSRTILARSRPHIHYNGSRYISVREAAALQSFPSTYRFFGSLGSQYSQVGNAVPVCLASAVARSVIRVHGAP